MVQVLETTFPEGESPVGAEAKGIPARSCLVPLKLPWVGEGKIVSPSKEPYRKTQNRGFLCTVMSLASEESVAFTGVL